jgi:uncharacterized membrane protein
MFATPAQHEAMNQMMARMMGAAGERRVHEALGRRFAGCGGGQLPARFGQMMGAVGAMGMMGGDMMGGPYAGPAPMMGGVGGTGGDEDFDGPSAAAMVGMMAILIGAVAVALLWFDRRRGGGTPLDVLDQRFARGDLTAQEYEEQRDLLGRASR